MSRNFGIPSRPIYETRQDESGWTLIKDFAGAIAICAALTFAYRYGLEAIAWAMTGRW